MLNLEVKHISLFKIELKCQTLYISYYALDRNVQGGHKRPLKCIAKFPAAAPCYSSVGFSISVLDEVSPVQGPLKVISKLSGDGVNDILARLVVPRSLGNQFRLTIKLTQLSTSGWGTTAYSEALT